jgi:hypothetical protein
MRVTAMAVSVLLLASTIISAQTPTAFPPLKHSAYANEPSPDGRIEGDTVEECFAIPSLPFFDAASTCGFANDYDEMCPYGGLYGPDVVYCYAPPYDMCVSISLCDSYFDTKVYVYADAWSPGNPWACNDDNFDCVDPPVDYTSWLPNVELLEGHTYYIVVDAYGSDCGDYALAVEEVNCEEPCDVECEGVPEGEPTCYYDYVDYYDGGCSTETYLSVPISDTPLTYCGESGVFDSPGGMLRDTDWYLINPCGGVPITVTALAEFDVLLIFVDMRGGCANMAPYSYVQAGACEPAVLSEYLPAGQFAIFVAPDQWLPEYECGVEYSLTIEGYSEDCQPTPAEARTWTSVKAIYR